MHSLGIIIALNLDLVRASRVVTLKCESLGVACSGTCISFIGKFYEICSEVGTVESESSGSCVHASVHTRFDSIERILRRPRQAASEAEHSPLVCLPSVASGVARFLKSFLGKVEPMAKLAHSAASRCAGRATSRDGETGLFL